MAQRDITIENEIERTIKFQYDLLNLNDAGRYYDMRDDDDNYIMNHLPEWTRYDYVQKVKSYIVNNPCCVREILRNVRTRYEKIYPTHYNDKT